MVALPNIYSYCKHKSTTMFNFRKHEDILKEQEKGVSWVKRCYSKYEETKNASCVHLMHIGNVIWSKTSSVFVYMYSFQFNKTLKCSNLPWYTQLYLTLKYYTNRLKNIEHNEVIADTSVNRSKAEDAAETETETETAESKTKAVESKLNEKKKLRNRSTASDSDINSSYHAQYTSYTDSSKNNKILKHMISEHVNEKENSFIADKASSNICGIFSTSRAASFANTLMLFRKSFQMARTENNTSDIMEDIKLAVAGKEEEISTADENVKEHAYEAVTTEPSKLMTVSTHNESNSNLVDENGFTTDLKKQLNLKGAWEKFSNLLK